MAAVRVALALRDRVVRGSDGVADVELQVPSRVEDLLGERGKPGIAGGQAIVVDNEPEVEVGGGTELAATVATDSNEADRPFARGGGIEERGAKEGNDEVVDGAGEGARGGVAGLAVVVSRSDGGARGVEEGATGGGPLGARESGEDSGSGDAVGGGGHLRVVAPCRKRAVW